MPRPLRYLLNSNEKKIYGMHIGIYHDIPDTKENQAEKRLNYASLHGLIQTDQSPPDISNIVDRCHEYEQRNLSANSLRELRRCFKKLVAYCQSKGIRRPNVITPEFLKTYPDQRCKEVGPTMDDALLPLSDGANNTGKVIKNSLHFNCCFAIYGIIINWAIPFDIRLPHL